jgi:hypothetical protein
MSKLWTDNTIKAYKVMIFTAFSSEDFINEITYFRFDKVRLIHFYNVDYLMAYYISNVQFVISTVNMLIAHRIKRHYFLGFDL